MALKAIEANLDEVPEALHEFYQQKGDTFILGIDGIDDHPSVVQLKAAHERQKESTREAKAKVTELETSLGAFGEMTPEGIEALRVELEQAVEGGGDSKAKVKAPTDAEIDELVQKKFSHTRARLEKDVEVATTALAERDIQLGTANESLATERIDNKLLAAASKAEVREGALDIVRDMGRKEWRLGEDGAPVAMEDDVPKMGAHGPLTMDEWAEGLRAAHDYLFKPSTGAGAEGSNARKPGAGPRVITDISSADDLTALAEGTAVRAA